MVNWSNSSDWVLQRCPRKFWFQFIHASPTATWGTSRREANILSNIQTVEQWRGILIHSVISDFVIPRLSRGEVISEDALREFAFNRATRQLDFSAYRKYREEGMTKSKAGDAYSALWEDEFGFSNSQMGKSDALGEIATALENLLSFGELLENIRENKWLACEASLQIEENGLAVEGKIDLLFLVQNPIRTLYVIDWKMDSKQNHDYAPQLWLYAYLLEQAKRYQETAISYKYKALPTWVSSIPKRLFEVNLLRREMVEYEWNKKQALSVEDRVFRGTRKIQALLDGRTGKEIEGKYLSVTENSNNCEFCSFRKHCQQL